MNHPEYIIIHCSDSTFGCAMEIDKWHKQRGWDMIGYHYVILNGHTRKTDHYEWLLDGSIEVGRYNDKVGAHCLGYNDKSIGICLIGIDKFSDKQCKSVVSLVDSLMGKYHISADKVLGHYETELANGKTCPNIDMKHFRKRLR